MRARYESFGGIIAVEKPAAMVFVDQAYMRESGYADSPLWRAGSACLSAPLTAHFAVTRCCPMRCQTCYDASGEGSSGELSTVEARRALDVLAGVISRLSSTW